MKIDEFRAYLKINKHALDDEIVQQPMLLYQVSEAFVEAVAQRDALKEALATIDARLDGSIRKRLEDQKVTEAMVKNLVQTDVDHEEASTAYMEAKQQADVLGVLRDAFASRGYMLRDLVQLTAAGYYEQTSMRDGQYKHLRARLAEGRE